MKHVLEVCAVAGLLACVANAQDPSKPVLRAGVSVHMPTAGHALEMRAADAEDAVVVALTAEGKLYAGVSPVELSGLERLDAETIYVKADAQVPFSKLLAVLDALRGKSVVLLTAAPAGAVKGGIAAPYGIRLAVTR